MSAARGVERPAIQLRIVSFTTVEFVIKTKRIKKDINFIITATVSRGGSQGDGETMMMTHDDGWRAIDLLAENNRLSVSDLARVAELDRSTFAKSRSSEMLAKQLTKATARQVRLASVNKVYEDIVLSSNEVAWISQIVWVSE